MLTLVNMSFDALAGLIKSEEAKIITNRVSNFIFQRSPNKVKNFIEWRAGLDTSSEDATDTSR